MKRKAIGPSKIKVKVDKISQRKKMDGRERHLTLGRLLEKDSQLLSADEVVNAIFKGYSILPRIDDNHKTTQNLFAIDLVDTTNSQVHIDIVQAYIEIGIPPFASFYYINDDSTSVFRLLFATNTLITNEEVINKLNAILRAIAAENGLSCICPSIVDGCPLKSFLFYGDIKIDTQTALNIFHPSYKKYIINENAAKIRYPKDWFRTNKYK